MGTEDKNLQPPLEGVRVLELGQVIAGTFGGLVLADLGAEVIKVESPRGDIGRNPQIANMRGYSAVFLTLNRGKKSVVLDLKRPEGLEVFYDLVRDSDAVIDNFRPGVLERLRVDYDSLAAVNPRIVCCSITGYGSEGPNRGLPSFDLIHQATSGLLSVTGERGGPPARLGIPLADLGTPLFGLHGLLAALIERERTGRGRRIEVSMFESMRFLHTYDAVIYLNEGEVPEAWGTQHKYHVPWQAFETADGRYVVVATREEVFWQAYCRALEMEHLADDPRFRTNLDRLEHRDELIPLLEERMRKLPAAEWLERLGREGVPAAPVNNVAEAIESGITPNDGVIEVEYGPLGRMKAMQTPIYDGSAPPERRLGPPELGRHTEEVLREVAGRSDEEIESLRREGVALTDADVADAS